MSDVEVSQVTSRRHITTACIRCRESKIKVRHSIIIDPNLSSHCAGYSAMGNVPFVAFAEARTVNVPTMLVWTSEGRLPARFLGLDLPFVLGSR